MKIRNGFVSNSSSSSFVVASRTGAIKDKDILDALGVLPNTVVSRLLKPFIELVKEAEEINVEDWAYEMGYESVEEYLKDYKNTWWMKLRDQGFKVCEFHVSNDSGDAFSAYLYDAGGVEIETPELKIKEM